MTKLTARDQEAVESFRNFVSWGEQPRGGWQNGHSPYRPFCWPPAVFAYVAGSTTYCPPKGTL